MNIIFDALQKTQKNRSGNKRAKFNKTFCELQLLDICIVTAIMILFITATLVYYPHFKKSFTMQYSVAKPQPIKPAPLLASSTTSQVIPTIQDNFVMINNQPLHVGDTV